MLVLVMSSLAIWANAQQARFTTEKALCMYSDYPELGREYDPENYTRHFYGKSVLRVLELMYVAYCINASFSRLSSPTCGIMEY